MNWIFFALAGSVAQLIDGTLGMGFGLTSSTLLLTLGASAAVASAAVHAAEIGTTLVSGASHWHAENVDKRILLKLAVPGGIGALLGATFLSWIDLSSAKIFISTLLLLLGFLLLYRNIFPSTQPQPSVELTNPRYLTYLGFTGGFVDASGGGGWGPIVTPTMMTTTTVEPRKIIGTVSAAEFIVAADPALIFIADTKCCGQTAETVAQRPGFAELSAVTSGNVVELDDDIASRWGPRTVDFVKAVVDAVTKVNSN